MPEEFAVSGMERVSGGQIRPVAPAVGGTERVSGGQIRPVPPAVGGTERVSGGQIRPCCRREERMQAGDGEGQFGPVTSVNGLCRNPDITW